MTKPKQKFEWNYRVYRYKDGSLGVHETYYDIEKAGDEVPAQHSIIASSDTIDELIENLEVIKKDILASKDDILIWEEHSLVNE